MLGTRPLTSPSQSVWEGNGRVWATDLCEVGSLCHGCCACMLVQRLGRASALDVSLHYRPVCTWGLRNGGLPCVCA